MKNYFFLFFFISLCSCAHRLSPVVNKLYNDSINRQFWSADWSPDDKFIAVAGVDSTVRIYHATDLTLYKSFYIPSWIHVVKWNSDGNTLAVATLTEYVQLIDINSEQIIKLNNGQGPNFLPNDNGSRAIGWNYSGDMLAVGGLDGIIKIWNKQGNLLKYADKYKPGTSFVSYLALDWHPYKNIFTACNFEIQVYDSGCRELKVMEHANKAAIILCTKWHPSGDFFVVGDYGHNWEGENIPSLLHFWSPEGKLYKSVSGSKAEYRNIDWNFNGKLLATASDVLRIWTKEGVLLHEGPSDGTNYLWGISWNNKGTRIVTASRHKTISLWDSTVRLIKRLDVK